MKLNRILRSLRPAGAPRRRGSALIVVILVVLVLTVVGLGIAHFTSTEDRMSGNTKMSRVGFYAAEAGLRDAEAAVTSYVQLNLGIATPLLAVPTGDEARPWPLGNVYTPPGGGHTAYLLKLPNRNFRNVVINQDLGDPATKAMYTVFIRNNSEDTLDTATNKGGPNNDTDKKVNLVVIGQMVLVDGSNAPILRDGVPTVGISKILEEQLLTIPEGSATATQKGANVGGTSSGAK
jgi:hypothetical protein